MKKISIITAVASAYATVAAISFALDLLLLSPTKAHAGEGESLVREVPTYNHSRQWQPDRFTAGADTSADDRSARMGYKRSQDRLASVQVSTVDPFDQQSYQEEFRRRPHGYAPGLWLGVSF